MRPTIQIGDYVLASPVKSPGINDVVIFNRPATYKGDKENVLSRVVGVGGDVVELRKGLLWRNGKSVTERFATRSVDTPVFPPVKIKADHFFVMGDNRDDSFDSRYWGTVPKKNVLYKVTSIYWSKNWSRVGLPVR